MQTTADAVRELETAFLAGGGELGALMRAHDWAGTSLGPPEHWPRSLKTVVRIMLTSRQPIWIGWGPELVYLYNDPYKSIIGGKHPAALGLPTATVWGEIWADIEPLLDSAMRGDGTFVESQLLIMERNGYPEETYYTFSYSPIPGDDGVPAGIICANADETQRVIGERQLRLLREMAARAADARDVAAAVARCTHALRTNRRDVLFALVYLREHGSDAFRLAGQCGAEAIHEAAAAFDMREEPWRARQVLASHRPHLVEALPAGIAWPIGEWDQPARRAMVLPIPPSGDTGQEGVMVVGLNPYRLPDAGYVDFLELVAQQLAAAVGNAQAYETAQRKAEELAELDRAKTQFFSNISHEFRTPLTLMMGPLRDLLADAELDEAARSHLEMAERNALRLAKLVNSLLEFSRIEAGRATSSFHPTDLSALTEDLASAFRSAMERAGLAYTVDCPPLPVPVYVDRDHWERIVLNLLSNALKFTLQGGVAVRLRVEGQEAVLEVADTGIGVDAHEVPRLFERFHRIAGVEARTHEGSGIGLALVQELVRLHRGSISAQSAPGVGTTFTLRLPLGHAHLPPEAVHAEPAQLLRATQASGYVQEALRWLPVSSDEEVKPLGDAADAAGLGQRYRATLGARVVVADDNADMRQYLEGLLAPYYRVEAVADGAEALDAVRRERPALVLSDVMMPRLDGFGLLAALRDDAQLRGVPVILLSARAGDEALLEGLGAGADDYLVKPFTARELLARVSALIELDRLRRSEEEQLRLSIASARMFTWDIDLRTSRARFSENAADVLGLPPRDLEGGFLVVHPDDVERHRAAIERAVRELGEVTDEIRVVRPDNQQVRWIEVRAKVICDDAGQPVRLAGISFDIDDRKRMEKALRESDRRKDEFLAMLAHELRNPMAPIRTSGELLLRMSPGDGPMRRLVDIINRQVRQLTRMVEDLLDVSRITRGHIEIQRLPVELAAVIAAAVEAVEPLMVERRHRLTVTSGLPITVIGDGARIQQCVVNLLTNAAKYTDPGGDIRIELARDAGEAVISVTDNGSGIAPDMLHSVFDLFVQSTRTLDRSQGGLGIGLSVVARLMEMHGGSVSARSEGIGKGSTFEMRLPATEQAAAADAHARPHSGPQRRVLVIDDNRDAAEALAMLLQHDGHEVRVGYGAQEALSMAHEWQPQVVILDIGLPDMDGYEVCRQLSARGLPAATRVIALTGYGQPDDVQRAREAGFHGHLVKPVSMEALAQAMQGR